MMLITERRMRMKQNQKQIEKQNKKSKNNLDERQEQMLLQIEHRGCWLAFWGLLIALIVQLIMGMDSAYMAGEWIVFMVLAVYIVGACARRGIWDRQMKPDAKTNLLFSIGASVLYGVVKFATVFHTYPERIMGSIAAGVFSAGFIFVVVFVTLSIAAKIVTDRQKSLDAEPLDEEDDVEHEQNDLKR